MQQHLYFIYNPRTELIKIGIARQPEDRLEMLQYAAGVPLFLLGVLLDGARYEEPLHLLFARDRCIGEWFVASPKLMKLAKAPNSVPAHIRARKRDLVAATERLLEARKKAGVRWRSVALRAEA